MSALSLLKVVDSAETPAGELLARDYRSGAGVRVAWSDGRITSVAPAEVEADAPWIAPALVELQVNGYAGIDYQGDNVDEAGLLTSVRGLRRDGCPRVLLTLITRQWPDLLENLRRIKAIRDANPELRRAIFGWHIEGPFISEKQGFIGAHPAEAVCDPTPERIEELKAVVGDDPTMLTLAPERSGSPAAIKRAGDLGIVISIGHSDTPKANLAAAVAAGAAAYTHLGNGCVQQLDRHDNILWRALDEPTLTYGVIPDGIHVSPQLFRIIHRLAPRENIYWTTDAMSAAGAPNGRYSIGRLEIEVGDDRIVRQPGKSNFAGSALEPLRGITTGAQMLGTSWQAVWDHFSVIPARLMGQRIALEPGSEALFCLIKDA